MYLDFYRFCRPPFQTTPDPAVFYASPSHREALAKIVYGTEQHKGVIVLTGELGVGKTTVLRTFLSRATSSKDTVISVLDPHVSMKELQVKILRELSVDATGLTEGVMVEVLHERLLTEQRQGRTVVLLIDEAQQLPLSTFERLRVLSNLETATDKLLQIVLAGQPEVEEILRSPTLRQLQQRVALTARIRPLTHEESAAYIRHRLAKAGVSFRTVFTDHTLDLIARYGNGVPRRINMICDTVLITGFGYQVMPIQREVVRHVLRDMFGPPSWKDWRLWLSVRSAKAVRSPAAPRKAGQQDTTRIFEALEQSYAERSGRRHQQRTSVDRTPAARSDTGTGRGTQEREMLRLAHAIESRLGSHTRNVVQLIGSQDGDDTVTVARDLSSTVARETGRPVLLVDANPAQLEHHRAYAVQPGLSLDVAIRQGDLDESLRQVPSSDVFLAAFSPEAIQAPKHCLAPKGQDPWAELRDRFAFVVVTSPSVQRSTAGLNLCPRVDGVVLVVEAETTAAPVVRNVRDRIVSAGGNLLGVVFTQQRHYIPDWLYARL